MGIHTMNSSSKVRDFVVGIDYDSIEEDKGHMTIRRNVPIAELVKEIIQKGSHFPQFPPDANPSITYAWDLTNVEDGDCYSELMNELRKNNRMEDIY